MSGNPIIQSSEQPNKIIYLESRLTLFTSLAENAYASSWRKFWLSQVETIRAEIKAKNVNLAIRPESEAGQ